MADRTDATERWYEKKARQMLNAFHRETGLTSASDMLAWLDDHRSMLTAASWRVYRSSLGYSFDEAGKPEVAEQIRSMGTEKCLARTASTNARRKQKKLPRQDHRRINELLAASRSRYAKPVRLLLEASRLTGLRPIEWTSCRIDESNPDRPTLIVQNAKATNGRSHGPYRRLRLDALDRDERRVVRTMVQIGQTHRECWERTYHQMQNVLGRITARLWPRRKIRPTLYTARHQFAADAKAAGLTRVEIAALMGHADEKTAGSHYGRRTAGTGSSGFRIEPDPQDVQNVLDILGAKMESAPEWHAPNSDGPSLG